MSSSRYLASARMPSDCAGWKSCPRCSELERQLQYWRKKSWYQKARDARWDKLKAARDGIPVNVGSKFTGMVVEKDAAPQGSQSYARSQSSALVTIAHILQLLRRCLQLSCSNRLLYHYDRNVHLLQWTASRRSTEHKEGSVTPPVSFRSTTCTNSQW